ncbi:MULTISPECIES: hypothetical protein [Pseudomonas]|uniref:hypothetical protein n=1 Tax=Pseudomonas TaxID=286 RepID=UPI00124247B8|nr:MULTISPECIES: hypothetical protein [Pseudomonas]MBP5943676.1 hypothetical protein [Pseudomonas sp. P9(2020)]MBZ9563294.1 hypothetical protein [Pseudomonas sp. P116]VVO99326.1 hypothetical protein PS898_02731 [Pseudomonas fluorescens]
MSYSVVVEFKDTNTDGRQEAVISRYNNGYASNLEPDVVVTTFVNDRGEYDRAEGVDDVEGNDGVDEFDTDTYTVAASLASKLAGLSTVGNGRLYSCILISSDSESKTAKPTYVSIDLFKVSNSNLSQPDANVKLKINATGFYKVEDTLEGDGKFNIDADGDEDSDANDKLIFVNIANSFVSMRGFAG